MLTLDSPAFQELRRDFKEWLPHIINGLDKFVPAHSSHRDSKPEEHVFEDIVLSILRSVARKCSCKVEDLRGPRRSAIFARPRMLAYLLVSDLAPNLSLPRIGRAFDRDHTTVMRGIKVARQAIQNSAEWRALYEEIRAEF